MGQLLQAMRYEDDTEDHRRMGAPTYTHHLLETVEDRQEPCKSLMETWHEEILVLVICKY